MGVPCNSHQAESVPPSAFSTTVSPCIGVLTLKLPILMSLLTTAIPCMIGAHALAVLCIFEAHLGWERNQVKLYKNLMVRMRPVAIALNYSIKDIWNDV